MNYRSAPNSLGCLAGAVLDLVLMWGLGAMGLSVGVAHLISLPVSALLVFPLLSHRATVPANDRRSARFGLVYTVLVLMALFLRGALLAWLTRSDLPPAAAFAIAAAAAYLVIQTGLTVTSPPRSGSSDEHTGPDGPRLILALLAYAIVLRGLYLGLPEFLHEEAYYWNYAQHLDIGYLDHPPLVAWVIWLFTRLLGHTELAVRLGAFTLWIVGAVYLYRLTRTLFDTATGTAAGLLFAILPVYFIFGFVMLPDAGLTACWAGALYYFHRALIREKTAAWFAAGFFIGLGMLSKYTMALLGGAVVVFAVVDPQARRWLVHPVPYLAAALSVLMFSPVILWNARHEWVSFAFQTTGRLGGDFDFGLPDLVGGVLVLLTPIGIIAVSAVVSGRRELTGTAPNSSPGSGRRDYRFLVLTTLLPLMVFVTYSLSHFIKLNWTGPLWLGILPFMAYLMVKPLPAGAGRLRRWAKRTWPATIAVLLLTYGAGLHYMVWGLPGLPYPQNQLGLGWPELARHMESVVQRVEAATGERPMLVGLDVDRISSWLAFYRSPLLADTHGRNTGAGARETNGRHLVGRESHMYRYWFPAEQQAGRPLVLLAKDPFDVHAFFIQKWFKFLGPVGTITSSKNGRVTGTFYYRVGYGYLPSLLSGQ